MVENCETFKLWNRPLNNYPDDLIKLIYEMHRGDFIKTNVWSSKWLGSMWKSKYY